MKNMWSPSEKVISPKGVKPAQQQFKNDCDINSIMARFQKTGAIDHVAKHQPQYGDSNPMDYHQSMTIIANANSMFADLPSSLRRKFNGNPAEFLEFVQDPKNEAEAKELGISLSPEAKAKAEEIAKSQTPAEPPAEPPAEQPAETPGE